MSTPLDLLCKYVRRRVPAGEKTWFDERVASLRSLASDKELYLALGYAPRRLGKADLALSKADLAEAQVARPGWSPADWSVDQAARLAFILASHDGDAARFKARLEQLFRTADVGELIAFYRGLPLYPAPELHVARAREGARTAMKPVFEAVAHRNPYPVEQFDQHAWNHMVLKALFIETALHPIQGLDRRANAQLARMLCDYAHERWAAGRPVSPELWRCVGPFADARALADLERVLKTGAVREQQAAAMAVAACPASEARRLLDAFPKLAADALAGRPGWAALA